MLDASDATDVSVASDAPYVEGTVVKLRIVSTFIKSYVEEDLK